MRPRRVVIALDRIEDADGAAVGAKAANLARLLRSGFPVPSGFCVTTGASREDAPAIEEAYRALARDGIRVAVRSSATAEDLPEHSFAGLYDTFLGVPGEAACLDAIERCRASLAAERSVAYCERNGIDRARIRMAVIVQRLVEADAAGIAFTADV
ncbi:MAG: pyruvate, water dikinase, partial [Planctomycetes bacterium]|nr:pyruvate, water dikinase [Planctomycetota bacterium]